MQKQRWAVVLAGGSGTRLQEMTKRTGHHPVPKQFCSLYGAASLLRLALARAYAVVPRDRVLCVVAQEHRHWWRRELDSLPAANIIVQPCSRGTAVGTLLPLLVARSRDSSARLVFLPADHYIADETVLTRAITAAFLALETHAQRVLLLGLEPDEADPELGYILSAGGSMEPVRSVSRFVEKPTRHLAARLIEGGALWNSFVFAARCETLLEVFNNRIADSVAKIQTALQDTATDPDLMAKVYQTLASADLSHDVFTGAEQHLAVLRVPACGWTDLGTPERVVRCLRADGDLSATLRLPYPHRPTHVDLASASSRIDRNQPA